MRASLKSRCPRMPFLGSYAIEIVIRDCFGCAFGSGIFDQKDVSPNRRLSVTKQLERLSGYREYNKNTQLVRH